MFQNKTTPTKTCCEGKHCATTFDQRWSVKKNSPYLLQKGQNIRVTGGYRQK